MTQEDWAEVYASYVKQGPVRVRNDARLYGAIGANGDWVIDPKYADLSSFTDGYALARKPGSDDGLIVADDGTEHAVRRAVFRNRGEITDGILTYRQRVSDRRGPRYGLWDVDASKTISEPVFTDVTEFSGGFAAAEMPGSKPSEQVWGIIDRAGNWVIDPAYASYREPERLASGLYLLTEREDSESSYTLAAPETGEVIATGLSARPQEMKHGRILVQPASGGARLINRAGETLFETTSPLEDITPMGDLAVLTFGSRRGAVDAQGNWRLQPRFDQIKFTLPQQVARAYDGNETIFVKADGSILDLDAERTFPISGMNRYARILEDERATALIDPKGQELARIEGLYKLTYETGSEGLVPYRDAEAHKEGFLDAQGKKVIGPFFDVLGPMTEGRAFFLRSDVSGRLFGFIDREGALAIPANYSAVNSFSEGHSLVVDQDGELFFINKQGEMTIHFGTHCGQIVVENAQGERTWPDEQPACEDAAEDGASQDSPAQEGGEQ
ncbi:WG repeat-containing protein [Rhodovibrio salinarum]|uniref:WG repeat-containing protein n=1 Tax=Rhodovibrio salinarum TaxID=1087 RepID=UPI00048830C6|nr:WG repeat-containing protein [Rhodovibrio salinarum]